jgi:hypothetical protein
MVPEVLAQQPYRCRFDWGHDGVRQAADRRDIVVVERATQLNLYDTLPMMRQERLEPFRP